MNTYDISNVSVGTVKRSHAAVTLMWFRRKVRQRCGSRWGFGTMCIATVVSPIRCPSNADSDVVVASGRTYNEFPLQQVLRAQDTVFSPRFARRKPAGIADSKQVSGART